MTEKNKPESTTYESTTGNPQLAKAMEEYLAELECGVQPNRQRFLGLYPDIAVELAACLEGLDFIHCVAPQLKGAERGQSKAPERIHPLATVGDFRIVRELGRGGMGVVYEAEQLSLGRTVALKVLPFAAMLDERQLKRFQNEARVMASLDHPHIVSVHGFGVDRCVHYYAMRLIEGQSLDHVLRDLQRRAAAEPTHHSNPNPQSVSDDFLSHTEDHDRVNFANETGGRLDSGGRTEYDSSSIHASRRDTVAKILTQMSPDDVGYYRSVARIGMQAAEALGYAHDNGVLHRDIKPGNLLLDSRGWLWVSDFGLAQIKSDLRLTGIGDVVGTLRYMSPEQLLGKTLQVDQRSDIYSLGATLYELTTLQPVFDTSDRRELLRQVGVEETPSPRQINKRIPIALSTIIHKCIQNDPADRYSTAQDVADDLGRFLQDQPIIARPPNLPEKAARWLRHHRSLAWTAAAFMAVLSCGLAASIVWISQERAEAVRQRNASQEQKIIVLAREESLRRYLYATDMRLAWQTWSNSWNNADLSEVLRLLSRHEPTSNQEDLRSFAWYYMKGLCGQPPRAVLPGHDGPVYHVAISPDGKTLATASQDETAKLWDLDTEQLRYTLRGHMGEVNCVAFAPDGQSLATASDDRTVKFWNPFDGKETFTQVLPEFKMPVHRVEFSTDGKLLMTGEVSEREDDAAATLWNLSTGRHQVRLEGHFPLALSPDSTMVATTNLDSLVRLWNVADGQEHAVLTGHKGRVLTGIFSADSQTLVTGGDNGIVRRWGVSDGRVVHNFLLWQKCPVHSVAYSPDRRFLVAGDEAGAVTLWDCNSETRLSTLGAKTARVRAVRFTPDGGTIVSASDDSTVKLWDITERLGMKSIPDQATPVTSIRFISNSELLSTSSSKQLGLRCNVRTGEVLSIPWNETNGGELCVAFSPSGQVRASATANGAVYLIDQITGDQRPLNASLGSRVESLIFSPNGGILVGNFHDELRVWDTASGKELHSLKVTDHFPGSYCIAFSPDGKTLALPSADHVLRMDLASGLVRDLQTHHLGEVNCLAYSPDGLTMATGSSDRRIKLWDTRNDQEKVNLSASSGEVVCIAFSPDGRTLVSGSKHGEVKLWDLATTQELFSLVGHTGAVYCAAFSPDGETLATAGTTTDRKRGEIRIWRTAPITQPIKK